MPVPTSAALEGSGTRQASGALDRSGIQIRLSDLGVRYAPGPSPSREGEGRSAKRGAERSLVATLLGMTILIGWSVGRGRLRLTGEMDGDQEAVGSVIGKVVALAVKGFVLALPHAEAIIRLSLPVFQIVNDDLVVRVIALHFLQNDLALSVVHLGVSDAGLAVDHPGKTLRVHVEFLPFEGIELADDVVESGLLFGGNAGIVVDDGPGIGAGAPFATEIGGDPDLRAVEFGVLVIALVHLEDEIGAAIMRLHVMLVHMMCRTSVEVAWAEHVATARLDVRGGDVEVGLRRACGLLLRPGAEENKSHCHSQEKGSKKQSDAPHLSSVNVLSAGPSRDCAAFYAWKGTGARVSVEHDNVRARAAVREIPRPPSAARDDHPSLSCVTA